jgi:hypothetical protein
MLTEPKEHEFPAVAARCFASAISFMLKEGQGIICQGEDEDGILRKYGVWYADGRVYP